MATQNADIFRIPTAGDPVLSEVVRRLVEAYRPEYIYLFGSVARGDAGPDSDYDIMVVVPDEAPREMQECDLAYRALRGLGIAKDVLVWTRSEFEKRLHLKASLPSAILREGKLLSYCMPPDPVRAADARAWLAKAAQDLRRVGLLLAAEPPDPEGGLFHSQQAAEKALKGFLTCHDVPFRRVHELDELGKQKAVRRHRFFISGTHEPG